MPYAIVVLATIISILLTRLTKRRILLPVASAAGVYFPFLHEIQRSFGSAYGLVLFWSVLQSLLILLIVYYQPSTSWIWRGPQYAESMFSWIQTTELPEGSAGKVLTFHAKQTLLYVVLAVLTANFASLILGSALLNYMNYYVAQLARKSSKPAVALVMGWNPWSVIRVLAFLWLGVWSAGVLLGFFVALPFRPSFLLALPGIAGVVLDVVLKLTISRWWSLRLRELIELPEREGE